MGWFSRKKSKSEKPTIAINIPQIPSQTTNKKTMNLGNYQDLFGDGTGILDSFTGSKYSGGYGKTKIYVDGTIDYYLLRIRSKQLYIENLYAAGLINRLMHNTINIGLKLQADPKNSILGIDPDELQQWTDDIETRFELWGNDPLLVDYRKSEDLAFLQQTVYLTAKLSGDCLVVLRTLKPHDLPVIQVIDGRHVQTPIAVNSPKNIKNGIEFDSKDRAIAYWVNNKRIPAFGEKSKRRIAWMVYGTKKLIDHTRGIPLLACALQALREVDRYTDSELRASFLNSILTAWIKRTDTPGTPTPFGRAAITNQDVDVENSDGSTKESSLSYYMPGVMMDKLAPGEEPVSYDTKRPNLNFGDFIKIILSAVAWGQGLPPEIYFLEFKNNFSASRQASNEFNTFLKMERSNFSKQFCNPYYQEWLSGYALSGKTIMPGYIEALRDPSQWEMRNAWQSSRWIGISRPSVDPFKEIQAYELAVESGFMSTSDAILELRGDDFDKVLARRKSEQEKINEALEDTDNTEESDDDNILDIGA